MADALNSDLRQLITAIRDLLVAPQPAAYEHLAAQQQLIVDRALALRGVLTAILEDSNGLSTMQQYATRLRAVVTEHAPVTYPTAQAEAAEFRPCYEHGYVDCGCTGQTKAVTSHG